MPQIFKVGGYLIYFWSNEGIPSEPIHVHITAGDPSGNATKVWITKSGHSLLCHNQSRVPEKALRNIIKAAISGGGRTYKSRSGKYVSISTSDGRNAIVRARAPLSFADRKTDKAIAVAVHQATAWHLKSGRPVSRYDPKLGRVYLEHPDGSIEYKQS